MAGTELSATVPSGTVFASKVAERCTRNASPATHIRSPREKSVANAQPELHVIALAPKATSTVPAIARLE